jgi:O-antigen biosynthesis protein
MMALFTTDTVTYPQVDIDLDDENSAHAALIRLVGQDRRVLEVGPGWGHVTRALKQRGCHVTCLELSSEMAAATERFCDRMIVGNIETADLGQELPSQYFDVITFGDVLEHLRNPVVVLRHVKPLLAAQGCIVASIPNVSHRSVLYALMFGEFPYSDDGLLDRTHLRFFTRRTVDSMFREAGFQINAMVRIGNDTFYVSTKPTYHNNLDRLRHKVFKAVLKMLSHKESLTFQFVVRAEAMEF